MFDIKEGKTKKSAIPKSKPMAHRVMLRVMLHIIYLSFFYPLKSPLDQNSIMIYHKFNGDFKSHINFKGTKGGQGDDM